MKHRRTVRENTGFTLVELMVVLLVVGVLLGLLLPALNMVKDATLRVKQKAQFHTIEVGLEAFRADMGDYPASYRSYVTPPASSDQYYYGAQRLAEALIGQDGFGFHPRSIFRRDGLADINSDGTVNEEAYHIGTDYQYESSDQNQKARKGPYVDLESVNAVRLGVYGLLANPAYANAVGADGLENYVLADMYRTAKNNRTSKLIGMPVLYYKANASNFDHSAAGGANNIYRVEDNRGLFEHPQNTHRLDGDYAWWYEKTTNPSFPGDRLANPPTYPRPYRNESFILHSAGADGFYGTEDDVFNFDDSDK